MLALGISAKRICFLSLIFFVSPFYRHLTPSLTPGNCAWGSGSTLGEAACFVRLACVRHAASVRPEPGSNSRLIFLLKLSLSLLRLLLVILLFLFKFTLELYRNFVLNCLELIVILKGSYAVLLSKFDAVFWDSFSSLSQPTVFVNYHFFLSYSRSLLGQECQFNTDHIVCQLTIFSFLTPCRL